ncbi:bifunctional 3-(3-hydroxy-phenyl)propionate/3-hydroxycinnamic acid hydroxylase [Okibacterium endophyticum]
MSASVSCSVLIVGAGPVGLMTANLLGTYGVDAIVIERNDVLIDYPRGVGIDDESLRVFQTTGLVHLVLPHTVPNQTMVFADAKGSVLAEISPTIDDFGWPRRNGFVQPLADRVLLDGLDRFPHVDVRFRHSLVSVEQSGSGVTAVVETPDGVAEITARYMVAADGGSSRTRRMLGLEFEGRSSSANWLVIDLRNDPLGRPGAYVGMDPARPYVSISIPHGIRRFEFMLKPGESQDTIEDPAFIRRLLTGLVPDAGAVDVIRRRIYTHHSRIANRFRSGNVVLAGDAAHIMPVWQGQGYNSGIRDAHNLAWKLAAIIRGSAGDSLLDSYDVERRGHAKAMIEISTLVGRVLSPTNRAVAFGRDMALRALRAVPAFKRHIVEMRFKPMPTFDSGMITRVGSVSVPCEAGRVFIQPMVSLRNGESVRLDDAIGAWFSVLVWNNDPCAILDERTRELLRDLGARLIAVRPHSQLHWSDQDSEGITVVGDPTGRLQAWFERHPESVVLLRPDRVVAGASHAQNAQAMVRAALEILNPDTREGQAMGMSTRIGAGRSQRMSIKGGRHG